MCRPLAVAYSGFPPLHVLTSLAWGLKAFGLLPLARINIFCWVNRPALPSEELLGWFISVSKRYRAGELPEASWTTPIPLHGCGVTASWNTGNSAPFVSKLRELRCFKFAQSQEELTRMSTERLKQKTQELRNPDTFPQFSLFSFLGLKMWY